MNISATYTMLPDLTLPFPKGGPASAYPVSRPEDAVHVPLNTDAGPSSGRARTYKYYVMSDSSDTVYTRQKHTEKLFAAGKGALLDLYA